MPTPFACHWCDKPTMNSTGICDKCEITYEEGNKEIAASVRELETRIRWLENGLKEIANGRDDMNGIHIKQQAQATLDGEPTTADEVNKDKCPIPGSRDYWEPKNEDETLEYKENMSNDKKLKDPNHPNPFNRKSNRFKPFSKNVVYISDINKEIAKEWNNGSVSNCCEAPFAEPGYPDNDICSKCLEHAEPIDYESEESDVKIDFKDRAREERIKQSMIQSIGYRGDD